MKKLNKFFAVLVALAMMATLCVSMAFAKSSTTNATEPYENATITVSKVFQIPTGVKSPAEVFKFNIAKVKVDDIDTAAAKATMPELTLGNITIAENTIASADNDIVKNGVITLPKLTGDVTTGFPHAGVYVYTLTEDTTDATTNTNVKYNTGDDSYDLYIYVANDGTVTPVVVDHGVTPAKDTDPDTEGDQTNKKDVDPITDPENPNYDDDEEDDQLSDVNFTNKYNEKADDTKIPSDNDPETPDVASAKITKTVPNTGGADLTKQFKFNFTYDDSNYQGGDTLAVKFVKIATDGTRTDITAKTKTDGYFTLANNETFAIMDAPVGATYSVTEVLDDAAAAKYTPKATLTTNSVAGDEVADKTQGQSLAFENALIEKGANGAAYTNTKTADTEPEGILISNLPYIALALVAIGGLVAYVVIRRRNADEA